ncbi:MAG: hypothetical protein HN348_07035 [Proteobacteria bacterium]|nr:hypothetical protein [Pseudomonadota bacterium]
MMNDAVRDTLRRLLQQDPKLLEQPRVVEAFLRDLHPQTPLEVAVLVEALLQRQLAGQSAKTWAQALSAASGVSIPFAAWAVQSIEECLDNDTGPNSLISDRAGTLAEVLQCR